MNMQSDQMLKEKPGMLSKLTVALCLMITAGLLISSLVSPGRAHSKQVRAAPTFVSQM